MPDTNAGLAGVARLDTGGDEMSIGSRNAACRDLCANLRDGGTRIAEHRVRPEEDPSPHHGEPATGLVALGDRAHDGVEDHDASRQQFALFVATDLEPHHLPSCRDRGVSATPSSAVGLSDW